jgi:hypothetical protein
VDVFEDKKKQLLDSLKNINRQKSSPRPAVKKTFTAPSAPKEGKKLNIAVFSLSDLFAKSLIHSIQGFANGVPYKTVELLLDAHMSSRFEWIILDMDPPTDWKMCHDVFTNLVMLDPTAKFILYSTPEKFEPAQVLEKKGAVSLRKPVDISTLKTILKV